jgi:hypothetical protein
MEWLRCLLWILNGVEWLTTPIAQAIALWVLVYGACLSYGHLPLTVAATLPTGIALLHYRQRHPWEV